jgi:hypothetical protein
VILAAVERQKQSREWLKDQGEYIPHPPTWLNGRRWDDDPAGTVRPQTIAERAKEIEHDLTAEAQHGNR